MNIYNPAIKAVLLDLDEFGEAEIHLHEDVLPGLAHTGERQTQVLQETRIKTERKEEIRVTKNIKLKKTKPHFTRFHKIRFTFTLLDKTAVVSELVYTYMR